MFLFTNLSLAKVSLWVKQKTPPCWVGPNGIEAPCSPPKGYGGQRIFDRKELYHFLIRSLTPRQATGNALAVAVQLPLQISYFLQKCKKGKTLQNGFTLDDNEVYEK